MRKLHLQMTARSARGLAAALPSAFPVAFILAVILAIGGAAPAAAEQTHFWRQSDYDEFQKGTAKGLALRSDGQIVLAPKFAPFADSDLAYIWALRTDSHGTLFAAGGANAKVIRLDANGKPTTVFESTEMSAQALVIDKGDNLYVGTSPDGKVYKVTPAGQKSVFFDPKTKYIWNLALGPDGTLYVATGDTGKIFSVSADGKSETFFGGGETHILALAFDGKGNLLAGTEPNGLILRIPLAAPPAAAVAAARPPNNKADKDNKTDQEKQNAENGAAASSRQAYVLYETNKKEITAIVPDGAGNANTCWLRQCRKAQGYVAARDVELGTRFDQRCESVPWQCSDGTGYQIVAVIGHLTKTDPDAESNPPVG